MILRFIHLKFQGLIFLFAAGVVLFIMSLKPMLSAASLSALAARSASMDGNAIGIPNAQAAPDFSIQFETTEIQLSSDEKAATPIQVFRGDRDELPTGARARFGRGTLRTFALSPDGLFLVTGGSIGVFSFSKELSVEIWRFIHEALVTHVAFSANGENLAAVSSNVVYFLDAKTGRMKHRIQINGKKISSFKFAPDDDRLALVSGFEVQVWETSSSEIVASRVLDGIVSDIAWSPDGQTLALGAGPVMLWDLAKNSVEALESDAPCSVTRLDWSADGSVLAAGLTNGGVLLWDMVSRAARVIGPQHSLWVSSIAISQDGSLLASGGKDGNVILWDVSTGKAMHTLVGQKAEILGVEFALQDAEIISGAVDGTITAWDALSGERLGSFTWHNVAINTLAWSPRGIHIAVGYMDGGIDLWDVRTGQPVLHINGHRDAVEKLLWSPKGDFLASLAAENAILVWDAVTGELAHRLLKLPGKDIEAVLMPDGTPVAGAIDGIMLQVAFSPDGKFLAASAEDTSIYIWELSNGELIQVLEGHTLPVYNLVYLHNGTEMLSMSMDGTLIRWDLKPGKLLESQFYPGMGSMVFLPDENQIAISDWDGHIELWRMSGDSPDLDLEGSNDAIIDTQPSPDGDWIASGVEGDLKTVAVWELSDGEILANFFGHTFDVRGASFSPDGDILATASWDGTVLLWDIIG